MSNSIPARDHVDAGRKNTVSVKMERCRIWRGEGEVDPCNRDRGGVDFKGATHKRKEDSYSPKNARDLL